MKVNIDLKQESFISFQNFVGSIDLTTNPMINSLIPGQWKGQVVPSVYLQVNDAIALDADIKVQNKNKVKYVNPDVDDVVETVTYSGIFLDIISYKNRIGLNFIIPNDPYVKNYRVVNSYIYPFLFIERNKVIGYEKKGSVNFYAVKYKKSKLKEKVKIENRFKKQ